MKSIKRVVVYGCAGSGKTTLALQLHKKLGLPIYHLDQYYWKPNWQRPDFDEFGVVHDQLCNQDEWIIEGIYTSYLEYRLQRADLILFLDTPRWLCFWRVIKHLFVYNGQQHASSPQGCYERFVCPVALACLKKELAGSGLSEKEIHDLADESRPAVVPVAKPEIIQRIFAALAKCRHR